VSELNAEEILAISFHETELATENIKHALNQCLTALSTPKIDRPRLERHVSQALEYAYQLEMASNFYAVVSPTSYIEKTRSYDTNPYRLADRVIHNLSLRSKNLNKRIKLSGNCHKTITTYPCLEIVFYAILDNALKYGVGGDDIEVAVNEYGENIDFKVVSFGPKVEEVEKEEITNSGTRGTNAISTRVAGNGIGLNISKVLCNLLEYDFIITFGDENVEINGIPYSTFSVKIIMS